jgi:hypothetical protein
MIMKIIVDNKLTYDCDFDVDVGDVVVVPAPWYMESLTIKGTVTKLGSDYTGNTIKVIRIDK